MGDMVSKMQILLETNLRAVQASGRSQKRCAANLPTLDGEPLPKRIKLNASSQSIYKTFYEGTVNFDLTVSAVGRIWRLHKIFMSKIPYLKRMLEADPSLSYFYLHMTDKRITPDALDTIFGAAYSPDMEISDGNILGLLSAAIFFEIYPLSEKCFRLMMDNLQVSNVVSFYEAARSYGNKELEQKAFAWLQNALIYHFSDNCNHLRDFNVDLMAALVGSPQLHIIGGEYTLYCILRRWLYALLNPCTECINETDIKTYFKRSTARNAFLLTDEGANYEQAFRKLRLHSLVENIAHTADMLNDNIIPNSWHTTHMMQHWLNMLQLDYCLLHKGWPHTDEVKLFLEHCDRFGYILTHARIRWSSKICPYGFELLYILEGNAIKVRRTYAEPPGSDKRMRRERQFMIQLSVTALRTLKDGEGLIMTSDIKLLQLEVNQEAFIMQLETKDLNCPLLVMEYLLLAQPV